MTEKENPSLDDWLTVDAAFDRALDLEGEARRDFLASLPSDLKAGVGALLEAASAPGPLDSGIHGVAGRLLEDAENSLDPMVEGRRIGAYRLIERIGAGGMGVVYLAERADGEFEHLVALKVVRWELAEPELIARFMTERRILAQLSHPHIATLLDGGMTPEGLPYLVLERVEGRPIDEFCEHRNLDLGERIALVETVCRAVDFAHRQLVVHRDLKPTNILVRNDGIPKLVDFGVAKLLEDASVDGAINSHTRFAPLTPRYAAPEQRSGGAASVATDVWALGVVIYELATGVHPFGESNDGDRSREPSPPSRSADNPALRGDLDNIISTALRFEPERRYRTAGDLADDLERWRKGLPVTATPSTGSYRLRKFIGRHRAATIGFLAAHIAAALGLAGVFWQSHEARIERDHARSEVVRAEQVTGFLEGLFASASPRLGTELSVRDLLDEGAERIGDELGEMPGVQARLLRTLGNSYIQLGDADRAEELMHRAVVLESELGEDRTEYVRALTDLGGVYHWSGRFSEAEEVFGDALGRLRDLDADDPRFEASLVHSLGMARAAQGDWEGAIEHYRAALDLYGPEAPAEIGMVRANLATSLTRLGRLREAETEHRAALAVFRRHDRTSMAIATVLNNLAINLSSQGRIDEAVAVAEECRLLRNNLPMDHPDLAATDANLAAFLIASGRPEQAVEPARSATEALAGSPPATPAWIGARANLGWALAQTGELDEAEAWLAAVVHDCEGGLGAGHPVTARARTLLGETHRRQGRLGDAERELGRAVEILRATAAPPLHLRHAELALGAVLCDGGRAADGLTSIEAVVTEDAVRLEGWQEAEVTIERARCLDVLAGVWDAAALEDAHRVLAATRGPDAWITRRAERLRSLSRSLHRIDPRWKQ